MELIKSNFSKHLKGEEVAPYEYSLITRHGKRIEAILTTRLIMYKGKNAILGTVTDITERKKSVELLLNSQEQLKAIILNAPIGILIVHRSEIIDGSNIC